MVKDAMGNLLTGSTAGGYRSHPSGVKRPWLGLRMGSGVRLAHDPGNEDLCEDHRIGPNLGLSAEMPTSWIDPRFFRPIPALEQQVGVGDRHLGVARTADNQHGSGRLAKQSLRGERQARKRDLEVLDASSAVENR